MIQKIVKLGSSTDSPKEAFSASFSFNGAGASSDGSKQLEAMQERIRSQGVFAWSKLHGYKGCDPQWFELWEYFVPKHGCSCSNDYAIYKASTPPDFSSPEALWLWGFNLHNHVNRKLGKPELTIEDARKLWRSEDGEENTGEGVGGATLQ